jgi:CBS domain-containing protein
MTAPTKPDDGARACVTESWSARRSGAVERLFPQAEAFLVMIDPDTRICDAATRFAGAIDLLVVCGPAGKMAGVVTKSDVLAHLVGPQSRRAAHRLPISIVMTRDVVRCGRSDRLGAVWDMMHALGLRNIPITSAALRPLGVVNARHALAAMLEEAEDEDALLRDYISGVGYR